MFVANSLTGVTLEAVTGGSGEEKLKVGKADALMGSEIGRRSGSSATWREKRKKKFNKKNI